MLIKNGSFLNPLFVIEADLVNEERYSKEIEERIDDWKIHFVMNDRLSDGTARTMTFNLKSEENGLNIMEKLQSEFLQLHKK